MRTTWLGVGLSAMALNPLRTALATLGVVIGVAALVAVLAIGDGVERFAREQIERTTDLQAIVISPVTTRMIDHQHVSRDDFPVFDIEHVKQIGARLPSGSLIDLSTRGTALIEGSEGEERAVLVQACLPVLAEMTEMEFESGRFFDEAEASNSDAVAVVSRPLADVIGVEVGGTLQLRETPLTVVGILEDVARDGFLRAYVPLGLAEAVLLPESGPHAPNLAIKILDVERVPEATATVESWLTEQYGEWEGRARVASNQSRVRQARQGMLIFKTLMGAFTGIALIVGGIGIMNVLLASVAERTREIGVRRATGARARDILMQFLAESVAVTSAGSLIGIAFGWAGAFLVAAIMRARTEALIYADATLSSVLVAALSAVLIGVVFGLYPAMRAARLSPIDAIRHE